MSATANAATLGASSSCLRRASFRSQPAASTLRSVASRRPSPSVTLARKHTVRVNAILINNDPTPKGSLVVKDPSTGIEVPMVQELGGHAQRCIGIGQVKAPMSGLPFMNLLSSNEYAVAVYVDPELAAKEFTYRERGGLELVSDDDLCDAVMDGGFTKSLHIVFAREMLGDEFVESIYEALSPRMKLTGSIDELKLFTQIFMKRNFSKGTDVEIVCQTSGDVEVAIHELDDPRVDSKLKTIQSHALSRGLLETFLGENSLSATTKSAVAKGARTLRDSDKTRREYLKRNIITEKRGTIDEGTK